MERDGWKCTACDSKDRELHVHHIQYRGELWEAHDDELQTLCVECHESIGPHPKGGIARLPGGGISFTHCPSCGSRDLKDNGTWDKCMSCGARISMDGVSK